MCGYNKNDDNDKDKEVKESKDLLTQVENALELYRGEDVIKIFTSGSFLDTREISREERRKIFEALPDVEITIETRPEFVTERALEDLKGRKVEIAIGLESANDEVLKKCVNKGFSVSDFLKASRRIKETNLKVKAYLLLKPPFLSEREALDDLKRSIDFCSEHADVISINPVNVQKNTLVEELWFEGKYRAPWLWSLVDALMHSQKYLEKTIVTSMPTGGGNKRGVHNCFLCDREVLNTIENCRIKQDYGALSSLRCECIGKWKDSLELERYIYGYPLYD
jgi:hypothetical protein